jgi:glycosyltransferase involved in cell wall biosynthesis
VSLTPAPIEEPVVHVVMPALDEEAAIGAVIAEIPRRHVAGIYVGDNGSRDRTAEIARASGATVVEAARRGYGSACLAALAALPPAEDRTKEIIVFLDADHSDHPEDLPSLLAPILSGRALVVIGSRVNPRCEKGALLPQARFGNWLATRLLRLLYGVRYTDLGPFRAIRRDAFDLLGMRDPDFGWTVELQARAARLGLPSTEVPVGYRRRVGRSKITGTIRGTVRAGVKIIGVILTERLRRDRPALGPEDPRTGDEAQEPLALGVSPGEDRGEPRSCEAGARSEGGSG